MLMLNMKPLRTVIFLSIVGVVFGGYGGGYSGGYEEVKRNPFLPALPGETPTCAQGGATYCEKINTYPADRISYLLYKFGHTYTDLLTNELNSEYVPTPPKAYGYPSSPQLPYDSYFPKEFQGDRYLPPPVGKNATHGKEYVDSYYRKRPSSYDYSYSVGSGTENHNHALMAAALPPILHSVWWNHRGPEGSSSFPHMTQYNQQSWNRRWRRRVKRQAVNALCPTTSRFINPEAAMSNSGNWMFVVNMGEAMPQFRQSVRSEICAATSNPPCSSSCSIPPGYRANCTQKYVQKRLFALDAGGQRLINEVFWFPHCCLCEISQF